MSQLPRLQKVVNARCRGILVLTGEEKHNAIPFNQRMTTILAVRFANLLNTSEANNIVERVVPSVIADADTVIQNIEKKNAERAMLFCLLELSALAALFSDKKEKPYQNVAATIKRLIETSINFIPAVISWNELK